MKKRKQIFLLSALLLWGFGQSLSALQQEFFITEEIQQELNLMQSEKLRLFHSYNQILIQFQDETLNSNDSTPSLAQNSTPQTLPEQNSQELSTELQDLLNQGDDLFEMLDNQLAELQEQLTSSETTIIGLQTLLSEAKQTITQLSENLTKAQAWSDQMGERLQENNEDLAAAYDHLDMLHQQNTLLKNEAETLRKQAGKNGLIGFGFAGAGFGVGMPLLVEGIRTDNQAMLWGGAGSIIGTAGVWLLGHYVFHWW